MTQSADSQPTVTRESDRFSIAVDGKPAGFTQFVESEGRRIFFHTVIDDAFEGQGLAGQVVREALDATRADGLRVVPVCPYVNRYVQKHDDWADLVERPTRADIAAVRAVAR